MFGFLRGATRSHWPTVKLCRAAIRVCLTQMCAVDTRGRSAALFHAVHGQAPPHRAHRSPIRRHPVLPSLLPVHAAA